MTIIVGVVHRATGALTMAADTANTIGGGHMFGTRKIARVLTYDGAQMGDPRYTALIGVTGDGALLRVARRAEVLAYPDGAPDDDLDEWAERVSKRLTRAAADATPPVMARDEDGVEHIDGQFLLGFRGRLWTLLTNQAQAHPEGIAALGAGRELAFGAMTAMRELGDIGIDLTARFAVEVACRYSPWCAVDRDGPYRIDLDGPPDWNP